MIGQSKIFKVKSLAALDRIEADWRRNLGHEGMIPSAAKQIIRSGEYMDVICFDGYRLSYKVSQRSLLLNLSCAPSLALLYCWLNKLAGESGWLINHQLSDKWSKFSECWKLISTSTKPKFKQYSQYRLRSSLRFFPCLFSGQGLQA